MESNMILIGSRALGIESEHSDWDYIVLEDREGNSYQDVRNDHFEKKKHCYHYPKNYKMKIAKFEIEDTDDIQWLFNAEDFRCGVTDINPFGNKDKWISKIKSLDFKGRYFWEPRHNQYRKRAYHIVYNLECLKYNTLYPPMDRVKAAHDHTMSVEDYLALREEINKL